MARPIKKGVDYFSHDTRQTGKTLFTLEQVFGNDGYAFWFKLLETLGAQENYYIDCNNSADWLYLIAKARTDKDKAEQIMKLLVELDAIDKALWEENRIIWVQNFINRLSEVFEKRRIELPKKPSFRPENPSTDVVSAPKTPNEIDKSGVSAPISTQSKVKESKVNKSKVKESERDAHTQDFSDKIGMGFFGNVFLTVEEIQKLKDEYGESLTLDVLEQMSKKCKASGLKFEDYYAEMLRWCGAQVRRNKQAQESKEMNANNKPIAKSSDPFLEALNKHKEAQNAEIII